MSLLGTLAELQPGLSEVLLSSPGLGPALEFSLLHTPERLVRAKVSSGVTRMALTLRSTSQVLSQCPPTVFTTLSLNIRAAFYGNVYPKGLSISGWSGIK